MKRLIGLILLAGILFIPASAMAATPDEQSFNLSASVPLAAHVGFTASEVHGKVWSPVSGTTLTFDPMDYKSAIGIWLPDHYFAIDIAPLNGSGSADVTVTYTEGNNPNAVDSKNGLGWKSTATFIKVVGSGDTATETGLTSHGPKKMLKDLNGENIAYTELTGGFLRVYVGVVSKDKTATYPDPDASEVFTNADHPGTYEGTLTFSATVVG